jgi:uncharacterized protein (DUF952 family)
VSAAPVFPPIAYKICSASEWAEAESSGRYQGSAVDLADGFIHLSAPDQVRETARKWFAGQDGLVLVRLDLAALGGSVRWEPSRGGALFPHVYGAIPTSAAQEILALSLSPERAVVLPDTIP